MKLTVCERCGTKFKRIEVATDFNITHNMFKYEDLHQNVCEDCVEDAKDDFSYVCVRCGANCLYAYEENDYTYKFYDSTNGIELKDHNELLCAQCAYEEDQEEARLEDDYLYDDYDDEDVDDEYCRTNCGGYDNYPMCKDSCKLFDD